MSRRVSFALVVSALCTLTAFGGCAAEEAMNCTEAAAFLAECTSTDQNGCSDDGEAASLMLTCSSDTKADLLGNGVPGDSCFWNWQCKGDSNFSCNHGNCFRRNTEGNRCDRGDDNDCLPELECADDLSVPQDIDGICSTTAEDVIPELFAETLRPGEDADHQSNTLRLLTIMFSTAADRLNGDSKLRRIFHSKQHTCVRGEFEVLPDIAVDLQVGPVFSAAQTFAAWVRFSNGSIVMTADQDAALQGLAIKLVGVEGSKLLDQEQAGAVTQDFLLIDLPATPTTDANEFVELAQAQFDGNLALGAFLLTHPRVALRALDLTGTQGDTRSARTRDYWAGGAYRLGERAMKYAVRPCAGALAANDPVGPNFLRDDLTRVLALGDVCFDFYLQVQRDAKEQSIEDASSIWDPASAPEQLVARVTIPQTNLGAAEVLAEEELCDSYSFNIWNSAPEYRPLGHINRARRSAYRESKDNRDAAAEPTLP